MRFLAPGRLILLVAPVVAVGAYLVLQRARRHFALRFTSVDLLASVAPRRPGWQRHVAPAVFATALVVFVLGFAKPARADRVPRQRGTIMLTLDVSGSMASTDVAPTRLAAAEGAARHFVAGLPPGIKLGLISFETSARVLVSPTTDRATVQGAIDQLQVGQGTATGDALSLALETIKSQPAAPGSPKVPAAIVLMSDGTPTVGRGMESAAQTVADADAAAKQAGVPIDTIAFGTADGTVNIEGLTVPVPWDPAAMAQIASDTNGKTFTAQTAGQLKSVYSQIGHLVGYDTVTHEVTAGFTGVGIALLILAFAAGLWWAQRIIV